MSLKRILVDARLEEYGARWIPLPHPSPRNNLWLHKNPWFEKKMLPRLRAAITAALGAE